MYKEKLKTFLDSLHHGLSDRIVRWAVDQYVNERKDWSPALNKAIKLGEDEGRFQASRERIRPEAQRTIAASIDGEGKEI